MMHAGHDEQPRSAGPTRGGTFPQTRATVLQELRSSDADTRRRAFDALVAAYWKAVYKHVRLKWHVRDEDARDMTQAFFSRAFEKGFFDRFNPRQAKFRTFLRTCLDGFVANERKAIARLKRGGGVEMLSLDFDRAADELRLQDVPDPATLDDSFDREWVRSIFEHAVEALREDCVRRGRGAQFALFRRYDIEVAEGERRPTYRELAGEFGLSTNDVTNHLALCRREFRRLVLDHLRRICTSDEEFRAEARALLGVEPT